MYKPFSKIVDLTHEMYHGMPNIGGQHIAFWPVESYDGLAAITGGKLSMESRMMLMAEHCGTHLDAPRHFDRGGKSLDQLPLEQLVLPGHLLDFRHKRNGEAITIGDFEEAIARSGQPIESGTAVVCWTGQDVRWGTGDWIKNRPYVPTETARWLVEQGMTMFATDLIGMDDPSEWWWPTHEIWLKAGICMTQQLCNLDKLAGEEFLLVAAPLKIREGTGCPVRAFALVK
jgi:arylformamidase